MAGEVHKTEVKKARGDTACPECGALLADTNRDAHLADVHGYLRIEGILLSRGRAIAQLWERVFRTGDIEAHERLSTLLVPRPDAPGELVYRDALEKELTRRAPLLLAARTEELPRFVRCLRQNVRALPHFRSLLRAADPKVREVGRELLLPDAADELQGDAVTAEDVRRWVDRLCPLDGAEEKYRASVRIGELGAAAGPVVDCGRELQNQRPVKCPECGASVPRGSLDAHLRREHHVYQYRGARRPLKEALARLTSAVCGVEPDALAWAMLQEIARDEYTARSDTFLAAALAQGMKAVPSRDREEALRAVAQTVAAGGVRPATLAGLAADAEAAPRQLALALAAALPALDPVAAEALRPLLLDDRLPEALQLPAAAALVRGGDEAAAREVFGALTAALEKPRAVERLRLLEPFLGDHPALHAFIARLESRIRMRCPRCSVQLRRPEMMEHLWNEHRLVLDGHRVREPWPLIDDWIEEYRQTGDVKYIERCRAVAARLDPEAGPRRVQRLLLERDAADEDQRRELLTEAASRSASLCPYCFDFVPPVTEVPPFTLSASRGRLTGRGYRVEVLEGGLVPRVIVERPERPTVRVREPGRRLTYRGMVWLLAGPSSLLALFLAAMLPTGVPLWAALIATLLATIAAYVHVRRTYPEPGDPAERVVNYAWQMSVPRLHEEGFSPGDSAFLAGLARHSCERGEPRSRAEELRRVLKLTERSLTDGAARHLGLLRRLVIADAAAVGADPVPLVVDQVGPCFDGKRALAFAEGLLAGWEGELWTPLRRARLRVLLCDRAFEAGFEVRHLVEVGANAPALGAALRTSAEGELAALRLLWSLRARCPWEKCGDARTVFELAATPETSRRLRAHPDLLLFQEFREVDRRREVLEGQVLVTGRGLVFEDQLFEEPFRNIEIVEKRRSAGGGFELVVDGRRFAFAADPEGLVARLERWSRFYFGDFAPRLEEVHRWQSPSVSATLREHEGVRCPDCRRMLLARVGEVGVGLEE